MEKTIEEIKIFVNKNFCSVHTKQIKSKAKNYLKLVGQKKVPVDENYLNHLQNMAN
jgi:hypothetical protein